VLRAVVAVLFRRVFALWVVCFLAELVLGSDLFGEFLTFLASGLISHLCSDLFGDLFGYFLKPCFYFAFVEGPNVSMDASSRFVSAYEYSLASKPGDLVVAPTSEFGGPCHVSNGASVCERGIHLVPRAIARIRITSIEITTANSAIRCLSNCSFCWRLLCIVVVQPTCVGHV
jgi:hypothetical protein